MVQYMAFVPAAQVGLAKTSRGSQDCDRTHQRGGEFGVTAYRAAFVVTPHPPLPTPSTCSKASPPSTGPPSSPRPPCCTCSADSGTRLRCSVRVGALAP